jgi:hypothetical protein
LLCQLQQVLAAAAVLVATATLAGAAVLGALLVAALARRQLSMREAFEEHRHSAAAVHTLPAEVLADQVPHLDSIMVAIARLPCRRTDSLAQSVGPQAHMSAESLRQIGNQTARAQLQRGAVLQIRGFRPRQIDSQIAQAQLRDGTGFRIRGRRPLLTDGLRQTVSRSLETMLPRGTMGTGTAIGIGTIHISTTIRSLSSSMASGGASIRGSIRTTLMTTIHTVTTAIIRTITVMVIPTTTLLTPTITITTPRTTMMTSRVMLVQVSPRLMQP